MVSKPGRHAAPTAQAPCWRTLDRLVTPTAPTLPESGTFPLARVNLATDRETPLMLDPLAAPLSAGVRIRPAGGRGAGDHPSAMECAPTVPIPSILRPQLAVQASTPPKGPDWLHEIKYDGYRTLAFVQGGRARFLTRGGHDWTARYGALATAFDRLPCDTAILDGELAVPDARGVTTLHNLQQALVNGQTDKLAFFAFDLVQLNGRDLSHAPLLDRKAALARLFGQAAKRHAQLHLVEHRLGDGAALFAWANQLGMEGIVSKRAAAPYVQTRSADWVKVKRTETGRFVVIGFLANRPESVSSLILAEERGAQLTYCCRASAGLTEADRRALYARLAAHECATPAIAAPRTTNARWASPQLSVELGFHGRTAQGKPRAPVLLTVRIRP